MPIDLTLLASHPGYRPAPPRPTRPLGRLLLALTAALLALAPASAADGVTQHAVFTWNGNLANGGDLVISADGRFVAFTSWNAEIVEGWTNSGPLGERLDVYVRDLHTGNVEVISQGVGGVLSDDSSWTPEISADGRYVAFTSQATNLIPGGTAAGRTHVYVRDRLTGVTQLMSQSASGAQANLGSRAPAISSTGRFVAFLSGANNSFRATRM